MARIGIIVEFQMEEANHAAFTAIISEHARMTKVEEPGCQQFDVLQPMKKGEPDHTKVMLVEVYADDAAFKAHGENPRLAKVRESYAALIAGRTLTLCSM
jgi:(4S)-4-hydroxy-5-phosphonooxypentane-2,3-dione isomerase